MLKVFQASEKMVEARERPAQQPQPGCRAGKPQVMLGAVAQ